MKIIKPSVQFYGAVPTDYAGALRFIEMAGRTCYRSEDKITEDSAEKFVRKLIRAGHLAMVEHSNFVVQYEVTTHLDAAICIVQAGKYLTVTGSDSDTLYVGGNLTAWFTRYTEISSMSGEEADLDMFAPFIMVYGDLFGMGPSAYIDQQAWQPCPHDEIPHELHRYSAKFICDRGVSHELVRHRPCSFAQESTRYVNYGGKDMEFIEPAGFEAWGFEDKYEFAEFCKRSEGVYNALLGRRKPQQARAVLPNALKTEIAVTCDAQEWGHIRKLRTAPAAHPDMVRVMNMMPWDEFLK